VARCVVNSIANRIETHFFFAKNIFKSSRNHQLANDGSALQICTETC
jgi:hypothetical protein